MIHTSKFLLLGLAFYFLGCGSNDTSNKNVIGPTKPAQEATQTATPVVETVVEVAPVPFGAEMGDFNGDDTRFYAYVKHVDKNKQITTVDFQDDTIPLLKIPGTYGGSISTLQFPEFDRDLLLVTTQLKDPQFNKYFLYVFRNKLWKPVVNGFAIHKSHVTDTLQPIIVDPQNPNQMFRYYSVFDLDQNSELGYTWRLLNERVPIINR